MRRKAAELIVGGRLVAAALVAVLGANVALAGSCGSASTTCASSSEEKKSCGAEMAAQCGGGSTILDTAAAAGSFTTLSAAIKAAGLTDALNGKGPFTVFAPTDEAFSLLPKGTVESLLKPENKGLLTSVLTYHVVPGCVCSGSVSKLSKARTLNGQQIDVTVDGGHVRVDGARVVKTDIKASNGLIHVIDRVIMPSTEDIVATAGKAGAFKTLLAAATAAGLADTLKGGGPFTVFAPTDEAFAKLPAGTVETLLKPENAGKLTAILTYHVVPGRVFAADVAARTNARTVNGQHVGFKVEKGAAMVDGARVVATDIDASNGVIHVIDTVILPNSSDIVATASGAGTFKTLAAALAAAGLAGALQGEGPFTVFAPTDEAFAKLPAGTVETLLKPENAGKLTAILKHHVVSGKVYAEDALKAKTAQTLNGSALNIAETDGSVIVNEARVVRANLDAKNGVIHVIDKVLIPAM